MPPLGTRKLPVGHPMLILKMESMYAYHAEDKQAANNHITGCDTSVVARIDVRTRVEPDAESLPMQSSTCFLGDLRCCISDFEIDKQHLQITARSDIAFGDYWRLPEVIIDSLPQATAVRMLASSDEFQTIAALLCPASHHFIVKQLN
eukprot:gnl/MRDRNA2_/MRDRNA2_67299_c0_seq3.p1 gnl/MRDRNA2_/MRDRNA2_67299_c0~~gnl/MRDRNA2_/MRDRNA2_67299_c0_seq3.p1  ORF type:complete len:148 (-),score=29.03 gnl/MRDRNA2_/MRDRNA2_67299_c0_seq3:307-750(-)